MGDRVWSEQALAIFGWFKSGVGNLVVRARAGVGKTTCVIEGVTHAPESTILLAAFNKAIATELQTKITNPRAEAKTLHSVGFRFVSRNWEGVRIDQDRGARLAAQAAGDAPDAMLRLITKLASLGKSLAVEPTVDFLADAAREHEIEPDEEWEEDGWTVERIAEFAVEAMALSCRRDGTIDFDDMIYVPVRNKWVRGRYDLVVVDECQDMSPTQIILAQRVCREGGRIAVVGDDRQAIYGFRGADSGSLDRLKRELSATELGLTVTYRCPLVVVERAQKLVPDYQAAPGAPMGSLGKVDFVTEKLSERVGPGDFVLSRKNAPLVTVCLRLLREGKRARIEGKDIGKGLVALVKKLRAKSVPNFLEKLHHWEGREEVRIRATGAKNADTRIGEMHDRADTLRALTEGLASVTEIEARITDLFADTSTAGSCVVCMSIHRSKGREADRVFLLEDTLYPGGRKTIEEKNVEYVGVTRARRELWSVVSIS